MISIRSGRGFGDSLYLQGVARHLAQAGPQPIEVCSNYPDVFLPLNGRVQVSPFRRNNVSRVAHYISRKHVKGTDQFRDCCINAGVHELVELRLDWMVQNPALIERVQRPARPIIIVHLPRAPMDRSDGYGMELLPDCRTIQRAIDLLAGCATIVQVGKGDPLFEFRGIDIDLANATSVADVIDVASVASGFVGYCSFIVPLAESLRKPALVVWSRRGSRSSNEFIRAITPQKIFHRVTSRAVFDDCDHPELVEAVDALCREVRSPALV